MTRIYDQADLERLRAIAQDTRRPLRERATAALVVACEGDPENSATLAEAADVMGTTAAEVKTGLEAAIEAGRMESLPPRGNWGGRRLRRVSEE